MLYFHKELKEKLKSDYQIQKAVTNKEYYKIESGLYSDVEFVNPLEIIVKKYPNAILTSDSAYYYYDLTDVIPDYFYLATKRSDSRISDKNINKYLYQMIYLTLVKHKLKLKILELISMMKKEY